MSWLGGVGDFLNSAMPKKKTAPTSPSQPSIEDLLGAGDPPTSAQLYQDALNQVSGAYQAQLGALDQAEQKAKGQQKTGDKALSDMYGALVKDIGANSGRLDRIYDQSSGDVAHWKDSTKKGINANYSNTRNDLASLFARMGIQAALPDAVAQGARDQSMFSSLADLQGQSRLNALKGDQTAALTFNTQQGNAANLQGKNARAGLLTQLNEALAGIGNQRNQVQGQMADAVSQREYQLEQDAMDREMQLQKLTMDYYGSQAKSGGPDGGLSPSQQYTQMGPDERGYYKASQLFGGDEAPYAMQLVSGVANNQNGGIYENIGHFIRSVLAENEKQRDAGNGYLDPNELQMLASYFYSEGGTGTKQPSTDRMFN